MNQARQHLHRRRGFMLMEIVVTLSLIALVATLSTQLLIRALSTGNDLAANERGALTTNTAVTALRRDLERTPSLTTGAAGLSLGKVTWAVDGDALVRTEGDHADRFGPLPGTVKLTAIHGVVTLNVGDAEWTFSPLIPQTGAAQ